MKEECPFCKSWHLRLHYFEDSYSYSCDDCGREWMLDEEENYGWGEPPIKEENA